MIVLLELRQSSQGIWGGFESSHHLSGRDDINNDTDANFSSLGDQVSHPLRVRLWASFRSSNQSSRDLWFAIASSDRKPLLGARMAGER